MKTKIEMSKYKSCESCNKWSKDCKNWPSLSNEKYDFDILLCHDCRIKSNEYIYKEIESKEKDMNDQGTI